VGSVDGVERAGRVWSHEESVDVNMRCGWSGWRGVDVCGVNQVERGVSGRTERACVALVEWRDNKAGVVLRDGEMERGRYMRAYG